jgi:hypothetical protein
MDTSLLKNMPSRFVGRRLGWVTLLGLAATLGLTPAALANSYNFSISGSGITASGVITASNTGPNGAYTISAITGTFSDSNNSFSGAINGLAPVDPVTLNRDGVTFSPPVPVGSTSIFSYDQFFYPDGDSPAVCIDAPPFFGGVFDIYGVEFSVDGGYTVDVWSNGPGMGGYQVGDSLGTTQLSPSAVEGVGFGVDVSTSPVPEPGSLLLLGTGLSGLIAGVRRRRAA